MQSASDTKLFILPTDRRYIRKKTAYRTDVSPREKEVNSDTIFNELCSYAKSELIRNLFKTCSSVELSELPEDIQQQIKVLRVTSKIMDLFAHPEHCAPYFKMLDNEIAKRINEAGFRENVEENESDEYFVLYHLKWPLPKPDGSYEKFPKPSRLLSNILLEQEQRDGINLPSPDYPERYPVPVLIGFVPPVEVNLLLRQFLSVYNDDTSFGQQIFHAKLSHRILRDLYSWAEKNGIIDFEGLSHQVFLKELVNTELLKKGILWDLFNDFDVNKNQGTPSLQNAFFTWDNFNQQSHSRFSLGDPYVLQSYLLNNKNFPHLRCISREEYFHGFQKILIQLVKSGGLAPGANLHDVIGYYYKSPDAHLMLDVEFNKNYLKYRKQEQGMAIFPAKNGYETSAILFKPVSSLPAPLSTESEEKKASVSITPIR